MGKIAFVFSGQGDQYPGMGKEYLESASAAAVFAACDAIRPGTTRQCLEGTAEELKQTENTQPCLYAVELAAAAAMEQAGIVPAAVAGFSLGEVAAAAVAGLYDIETGFRLVTRRGMLMQQAADAQQTSMAAVLKLSREQVEALCSRYGHLYPVNFNCPGQIAVAGDTSDLKPFLADVKAAGGRAVPLKVAGAFHSPYMEPAAREFGVILEETAFEIPRIPLYSDLTGEVYGDNPAELLSRQICCPVQWERLIRNLIASGVDTFYEMGPGRTLCNLIRKIDPSVTAVTAAEKLEECYADR